MLAQSPAIAIDELASVLPKGGATLVSSCSAHSHELCSMVALAGDELGEMEFSGIFVPGLNRETWVAGEQSRILTFFQTPELRGLSDKVNFLPISYAEIAAYYDRNPPDAVLFMCSPPDKNGFCSFGTECSFVADLWSKARYRIAHVNPLMPRPPGYRGIPWDQITGYVEADQPLLSVPESMPDDVSREIARHLEPFIDNGATLQTGLGKVPDAVLDSLHDRQGLRMHTGLVGDGALRLAGSGALAGTGAIVAGTAIGSQALYDALEQDIFDFQPVSVTHDVQAIGGINSYIALNSALSVDLFGQAFSEVTPQGAMSGPGGAIEYAQGAKLSRGGLSVVALQSTAKGGQLSRIVAPGNTTGPVALNRLLIDLVVTEHGVADFRGTGHEERAEQLIAIAAPQFRSQLADAWAEIEKAL